MTTVARTPGRMADVLSWLNDTGFGTRGFGLVHDVRIEDYVEDGVYVLRAEIPGVDADKDLEVFVDADTLVVRGERRDEQHDKDHRELHYGSFERAVRLPDGSDRSQLTATYTAGVLEVRVPFDEQVRVAARQMVPVEHVTG